MITLSSSFLLELLLCAAAIAIVDEILALFFLLFWADLGVLLCKLLFDFDLVFE